MAINMNIKIITGRRGMNIKRILQEYDRDFEGYENILKFPETEILRFTRRKILNRKLKRKFFEKRFTFTL